VLTWVAVRTPHRGRRRGSITPASTAEGSTPGGQP
jgi:hypothetical protein